MLDPFLRPIIDIPLNYIGKRIASYGVSANMISVMGFVFGAFAILMICLNFYISGLIFILMNRVFDGLDGAVARYSQLSDFGGFLDIVFDFIIYSGVVFAFGISNSNNLIYCSFLIFSFVGPMTSFLAYASIAAKKNIVTIKRGKKSFYHLGGICEGTETALTLILLCVFPQYLPTICIIYGVLCWMTTGGRVYIAWQDFAKAKTIS